MFSSTSMLAQSGGERIQNCQNEDEALDVTYSCATIKDKLSIVWELKPVEPRKRYEVNRVPLRLTVVIDISHSMSEPYGADDQMSKLDKVKLFAQLLAATMDEEDYMGIVTFGTVAQIVMPLTKMDPEAKESALICIEEIGLGGVTNLGAGLTTAVDLFKSIYSKNRYFNDNIVLFTDGMANEGITETDDMIRELRRHMDALREESHFPPDYTIKLATLGTGGFLPELLYNIGMAFSSDAFYFLNENTNLELNMMKPILLRQTALVSSLKIQLTALNGVLLDKSKMTNEYEPYNPDGNDVCDETKATYYIHDIASDMSRHLICYLRLPAKHKKTLKNKDVLSFQITFRDSNSLIRTVERTITYVELPIKEVKTLEKDIIVTAQHETRVMAQKTLNRCSDYMKRLDRTRSKGVLRTGGDNIRAYCEHVSTLISEECTEYLNHWTEPILANLEFCDKFLSDLAVRWDDAWARLKAMSSSLGREVPTAAGVFMEGAEMYTPLLIDERMDDLCSRLRAMYVAKGLSTETIDQYKTVMKELQDKLEQLEQEGHEYKETRI